MQKERIENLLNRACEIITELEHHANEEQMARIESIFNEILFSDELDEEMDRMRADFYAQDTWKKNNQ
jgi:hypothetical protein